MSMSSQSNEIGSAVSEIFTISGLNHQAPAQIKQGWALDNIQTLHW